MFVVPGDIDRLQRVRATAWICLHCCCCGRSLSMSERLTCVSLVLSNVVKPQPLLLCIFIPPPPVVPRWRHGHDQQLMTNGQRDRLPQDVGSLRVLRLPRAEGVVDVPHEWNGDRHESAPARQRNLLPSQRGRDPVHTTSGKKTRLHMFLFFFHLPFVYVRLIF